MTHQNEGRVEVMLNLEPAEFEAASIDADQLRTLFGGSADDLESSLPVEFTASDFFDETVVEALRNYSSW